MMAELFEVSPVPRQVFAESKARGVTSAALGSGEGRARAGAREANELSAGRRAEEGGTKPGEPRSQTQIFLAHPKPSPRLPRSSRGSPHGEAVPLPRAPRRGRQAASSPRQLACGSAGKEVAAPGAAGARGSAGLGSAGG